MKTSRTSAFTLIELLVVICVIAILAGIAMPVFSSVIEKGKATTDASNLRQIGIGLSAYLTDHEDQMIRDDAPLDDGNNPTLHPKYLPIYGVFQSPWDDRPKSELMADAPVSYWFSSKVLTPSKTGSNWNGNMSNIRNSSATILLANVYKNVGKDKTPFFKGPPASTPKAPIALQPGGGSDMKYGTHGGGNKNLVKVLYCDLHVDTLKFTDFKDQTTNPQLWDPLADPK